MLSAVAPLLVPLALTTSENPTTPPSYHRVQAYVTGYNTVAAQTSATPCIAASGENICGRHDTVACPRHISLGTVVEIRGITYTCEDRLARKYDSRFDISCDKDMACPYEVTGWAVIKVYDRAGVAVRPAVAVSAQTGKMRFRWARQMRAVTSSAPAMTRTPSSSLAVMVSRVPSSRKKTPYVRHAANTASRA